ncbi:MAG: DoxX family protein [Halomonas sp.]|uniref:DoxX family protein n=1 Tax=Halomonas sp. TaxID=1486246 RepID=UPI0039711408
MMPREITTPYKDSWPGVLHAHWLLCVALASVFFYMGIDKFMGGGIGELSHMMALAIVRGGAVALGEIAAGLLILLGGVMASPLGDLATRLAALIMAIILLGAIFIVHWGEVALYGHWDASTGWDDVSSNTGDGGRISTDQG